MFITELHQVLCGHSGSHSSRASQIQHHRGRSQGLRDEGFFDLLDLLLGGHKRKVHGIDVIDEEGSSCCGGATLGSISKLSLAIFSSVFSIFAKLAFSFALLSFLAFSFGCVGFLGLIL